MMASRDYSTFGVAALQVIRIGGYIANEKVHIARQYLEPQTHEDAGVPKEAASITDEAMTHLITEYARQADSALYVHQKRRSV